MIGFAGNNIDHTGNCIRAIKCCCAIFQHFNMVNRCGGDHVQIHWGCAKCRTGIRINIGRCMPAFPIDQHQNLIWVQPPHTDCRGQRPGIIPHSADIDGRIRARQCIRQVHLSGPAQRGGREHADRRCALPGLAVDGMRASHNQGFTTVGPGGFIRGLVFCSFWPL
ncbi:hypothetical protein Amal_03561 [Acetobacter malorum]|uniref:Uncharacterized protein n=1 Tax=Acetobacter malorum TaxID=178901 RepID=A0A177G4H1_9PROT|nr:hypothetical protein Amal_03561 [Acetobacter malorum]